jgi:hypothetical protein
MCAGVMIVVRFVGAGHKRHDRHVDSMRPREPQIPSDRVYHSRSFQPLCDESIAVIRQPGAEHRYLQGSSHIVGLDRRGAIALRQKWAEVVSLANQIHRGAPVAGLQLTP